MPVYLRNFYTRQLQDTIKKENDSIKKQSNSQSSDISKLNIPRNPRFKQ